MSVQLVLTAVGAVVGGAFGYPQAGAFLGSLAGAALTPKEKIQGPKLDDLSAPRLQYGQAIPRLYGTQRVTVTWIWVSDLQPHESTEDVGGKGGGGTEVTSITYTVDALGLVSIDTPIVGIARAWVNKRLVYSVGPDSTVESRAGSATYAGWTQLDVMDGNPSQTPWPPYETAVGSANAPAYRHRSTIGVHQLDLGNTGQMPLVEFEVFTVGTPDVPGYQDDFSDGTTPFTGDLLGYFTEGTSVYGPCIQVLARPPGDLTGPKTITKSFTSTTFTGFRVKFHMSAMGGEDGGQLTLLNGISGVVTVNPHRETAFDALQRCHLSVSGQTVTLGSVALDMLVWHEVQVDLVAGAGNSIARLFNLETGLLIEEKNIPTLNAATLTVDGMNFFSDGGLGLFLGTGDTLYSQLDLLGEPATIETVDLRDIMEAEWARVGDAGDLDASALDGIEVKGYAATESARAVFEELARIYYFGAFCDDKLRLVLKGGASAATLTYSETGAGVDEPAEPFCGVDRADDLEVPAVYSLVHPDPTRDYEPITAMSDRLTDAKDIRQLQTTVVLTPTEGKGRADSYARDAFASSQTWQATVGIAHLQRTPTDVITLTDSDGTTYRSRIDRATLADFVFAFEGTVDDVNALSDEGIAAADGEPSITVTPPGTTVLELIDGPILRDDDDDAGLYGAVRRNGAGTASRVLKSIDGTTFAAVGDVASQAVMGAASTALGDVANPYVWDEGNSVTVTTSGALSSSTRDAMQADPTINVAALKSGDGWEYLRFRTATLDSPNVYTLSGLIRGIRGTEEFIDGHAIGDKFVILGISGMLRIPGNSSEIGLERFYRGVTIGSSSAGRIALTNQAVGLKPFSPTRLMAARDSSGDITLSWSRRTRMGVRYVGPAGILAPLGEDGESYQVDIYDGGDVVRTLVATSESVSYSSANQTTDFGAPVAAGDLDAEVFQLSAVVGRGYGHRKSV